MHTDWMDSAACQNIDEPEKFFDLYVDSDEVADEVQNLCVTCPVKIYCLNYGLYTKATGVWGGRWLSNGKIVKNKSSMRSTYYWRD